MSVYVQVCLCVVSRRMEGKHTYIIGMKMRWATIDDGATISFMLQKINLKKNWSLIKILICKKYRGNCITHIVGVCPRQCSSSVGQWIYMYTNTQVIRRWKREVGRYLHYKEIPKNKQTVKYNRIISEKWLDNVYSCLIWLFQERDRIKHQ